MPLYTKLALKGGGVKGIIYIGVIRMLDQLGVLKDIDAVSGSSAGAIGALLVATGWDPDKISEKLLSLDYNQIIYNDSSLSEIPIIKDLAQPLGAGKNLERDFGLHRAVGFEIFFKSIVKEVTGDENATFLDWHRKKEQNPQMKDLYVEACNINTGFNEEFSIRNNADVQVWKGIRASMAFPFFFTPVIIRENPDIYFCDGGIQKNCPNNLFEIIPGQPNPEVLSVWLDSQANIEYYLDNKKPAPTVIKKFTYYLENLINAITSVENYYLLNDLYRKKMIYCDTVNIGTLDFSATKDQNKRDSMIMSGEYGTAKYFLDNHPEMMKNLDEETCLQMSQASDSQTFTNFINRFSADSDKAGNSTTSLIPKIKNMSFSHKWLSFRALTQNLEEKIVEKSKMAVL